MRLYEFVPPAVNAAIGTNQVDARWAQYGPGVLQAAEELAKGRPTKAVITALRTAAPKLPISKGVQQGLDNVSDLELLSTVVRNPSALAAFLATYSRGLNTGEDDAIKRIHAQQDAQMGPRT
jgi:hypothetical protein